MYNLPSGLYLAAGTGEITGTPDATNMYTQTVMFTATDDNGTTTESVDFPTVDSASSNVAWNATLTGFPTTLTENAPMTSFELSNSINDPPATKTFNVVGAKPSWLTLAASGQVSGTPTATAPATNVTFRVEETGNASNSDSITVSFPPVDAGDSITFSTAAGSLGSVNAGESINETIVATASNSAAITYTFSASNDQNATELAGTSIDVTGNVISGIAPRLYVAATYSFAFTASTAGGIVNSATFSINILQDATCITPTDNICI